MFLTTVNFVEFVNAHTVFSSSMQLTAVRQIIKIHFEASLQLEHITGVTVYRTLSLSSVAHYLYSYSS